MKYNVKIMSRYEVMKLSENNKIKAPTIVISINDSGYTTHIDCEYIIDVLPLEFDDIEHDREALKAMSVNDGIRIKDFIDKYKDRVNNVIIHCTAGISRSAGVGCGIALYLNGTDDYIWSSKRYLPNKRCYYITTNALGIHISKEDYKYKSDLNKRDNSRIEKLLQKGYITLSELLEEY